MHSTRFAFLIVATLATCSGCLAPGESSYRFSVADRRPRSAAATPRVSHAPVCAGTVTLEDALAATMIGNPDLNVFPYELRAAEARVVQAAVRANPQLDIAVEEFAGSGQRSGFDAAETTVQIGQPIELGGKRAKRAHVAALDKELVEWDFRSARLDVVREVRVTFAAVLAAQDRLALAQKLLDVSLAGQSAVARRVEVGKDSPVDAVRAEVAVSTGRIEMQRAAKAVTAARHRLAALWGSRGPAFEQAAGDLYRFDPPVPFDEAAAAMDRNPDLARGRTQEQRLRAALRLEKARGMSDVIIGGGVRRFEETDDASVVFGLSLPIPIFDRNQGGIREAMADLARARRQYEATRVKVHASLYEAVAALASAYDESVILRDDVLPRAQQAFDAAQQGYEQGKFDYLYVLDTQRTLFETEARFIDVAEAYHQRQADVDRLTGRSPGDRDEDNWTTDELEQPLRESGYEG